MCHVSSLPDFKLAKITLMAIFTLRSTYCSEENNRKMLVQVPQEIVCFTWNFKETKSTGTTRQFKWALHFLSALWDIDIDLALWHFPSVYYLPDDVVFLEKEREKTRATLKSAGKYLHLLLCVWLVIECLTTRALNEKWRKNGNSFFNYRRAASTIFYSRNVPFSSSPLSK